MRLATEEDIPALHALIEASVRGLQAGDYTPAQIEGALGTVLGLDTQLIRDRTYLVAETVDQNSKARKRWQGAAGGRSGRRCSAPITGRGASRSCSIRRRMRPRCGRSSCIRILRGEGLGSLILATVEDAARAAGFTQFEMGSTLTGVPLYRLKGYVEMERIAVPLKNGEALPVVRMVKASQPFIGLPPITPYFWGKVLSFSGLRGSYRTKSCKDWTYCRVLS